MTFLPESSYFPVGKSLFLPGSENALARRICSGYNEENAGLPVFRKEPSPMVLDFPVYQQLKEYVARQGLSPIHMHDACGGQYFTVEHPDEKTADAIRAYFAPQGVLADFTEDLTSFILLDQPQN